MDIQKLLYINLGLTILTLIGLICVIVYIALNNQENYNSSYKSKDNFADEDFTIPSISVPPENFENTLITDADGNMNTFSLKQFADDITASINAVHEDLQKQIDKKSDEIDDLTAVTFKKDTIFKLKVLGTQYGPDGGQSEKLKDGGYVVVPNAGGKTQLEWRPANENQDWQILLQVEEAQKNW